MTQEEINSQWTRELDSNVGKCTLLVPPIRRSELRRPYQYLVSVADFGRMFDDVKALTQIAKPLLQCELWEQKGITYGRKIHLFLLGFRPGLVSDSTAGITKPQWEELTTAIAARLNQTLAETLLYVEPWTAEAKFQARLETYVMFTELKPQ